MTERRITQWAPWPDDLEMLIAELDYDDRFRFTLSETVDRDFAADDHGRQHCIAGGTTLEILLLGVEDSYHPGQKRPPTVFYFPVPPYTFDRENWTLWLFDRIEEVTRHENMEHFRFVRTIVEDGDHRPRVERPLAPLHGPGQDPNRVHLWAPDDRRRTSFRGVVKDD